MTLKELAVGGSARVLRVGGEGALRQHFLDMGVIPGAEVTLTKLAPMGDPIELRIHGYELTLRLNDAANIDIEPLTETEAGGTERDAENVHLSNGADSRDARTDEASQSEESEGSVRSGKSTASGRSGKSAGAAHRGESHHPGLGEAGKFHPKDSGDPLPDDTILTFALVGNQNSGKTTLFNQLTGANQHVGNFPGVTVDRKDGAIRGRSNTSITDLPGIYSMSPYSSEEMVSRNFVLDEKPRGIINIVDATNIERNLYLTMQLLEMNTPMVVALNMMDEMTGNGGWVDINAMENMLGVPVVPISAVKNQGVDELVRHAIHVAHYQEKPLHQDFCGPGDHGGAVHRCLHAVVHLIEDHAERAGVPVRFAASKLIEGDKQILKRLELDQNEQELLEHIVLQMEKERGLDAAASIADMRYAFIEKVCANCVTKPRESAERIRSERIDRILTGRFTAIPVFIGIMALVFYLTFNVIGAFLQDLLDQGISAFAELTARAMAAGGVNEAIQSLILDGIFEGVGSVLSFLPIIVTMFFFLSILEDSGYIARVAFFMDKLLRRIGLSGRSIVPMLIGFGCTVPAVMSTRTLPSARDRNMTILLTPFMSCTAKLPIYAFFVNAFFPGKGALVMTALYVLGIVCAIGAAFIFRNTLFKGEAVPFVMELPNYRMPGAKNVLRLLWDKAKDFLQRAFSVILIATVVVWFLQSFDFHFNLVDNSHDSILAVLGGALAPMFAPLGLGDWRIVTSFISGFMAKESVVSVLEVLYGTEGGVKAAMGTLSAITILVFSLLYTPCVAAIAAIRRELGSKWAFLVVLWQCGIAYVVAFLVRILFAAIGFA